MDAVSRQLKKGFLDILLLHLLGERAMYGYELMTALQDRSHGYFELKEGTLYPILYRLEDAGHIRSAWETERRAVPRKYYSMTDSGKDFLAAAKGEIRSLMGAIRGVLGEEPQ